MHYEELKGPLTGWTYDSEGVIHTRSGYRATAQQIESALWLLGCWASDSRKYWIHSDEGTGALRRLHDTSDYVAGRTPEKAVLREEEGTARAVSAGAKPPHPHPLHPPTAARATSPEERMAHASRNAVPANPSPQVRQPTREQTKQAQNWNRGQKAHASPHGQKSACGKDCKRHRVRRYDTIPTTRPCTASTVP